MDNFDDVFVADSGNCRIRVITGLNSATPNITTLVGDGNWNSSGDGGPAADAELDGPGGVGVDLSGSHVYIADTSASRVREVSANLAVITGTGKPRIARGFDTAGRQRGRRRWGLDFLHLDGDRRQRQSGQQQARMPTTPLRPRRADRTPCSWWPRWTA